MHIYTPQAYKAAMVEALSKKHGVRSEVFRVIDLYAIPDYNHILKRDKISIWTKMEDTQLQWRFHQVQRSAQHRFGVQTTYRYYSQDRVFVLRPIAEEDTGANVGYRPELVEVTWQPGDDEFLEILQALPEGGIPPVGFYKGSAEVLKATVRQVEQKFKEPVKADWQKFQDQSPISDDVQQYLADEPRNNASSVAVVKQWEDQLSPSEQMRDTQQLILTKQLLHVPFMKVLFRSCTVDTKTDISPIEKKLRDDKQRWVESNGLPFYFDGKPLQLSKTQASVQHKGNKGKTALRLAPTAITDNGYDDIEALPEMAQQAGWQRLVGNIGAYTTVTQQTLSLLLKRMKPNADVPASKTKAWSQVHEAAGLAVPPLPAPKQRKRAGIIKPEVNPDDAAGGVGVGVGVGVGGGVGVGVGGCVVGAGVGGCVVGAGVGVGVKAKKRGREDEDK